MEEYGRLTGLIDTLPHGAAELAELGTMFESVGLGEDAVRALTRLGDPKAAIDACVRLNHWERCSETVVIGSCGGITFVEVLFKGGQEPNKIFIFIRLVNDSSKITDLVSDARILLIIHSARV